MKKTTVIPLMTLTISLIIGALSVMMIFLSSCTNNNFLPKEEGYYYIDRIDSVFFVKYNSIFLLNNKNEKIWLLSEKLINKDTLYYSISKYHLLKENSIVKLNLLKNDTLKFIEANLRSSRGGKTYYDIDKHTTICVDEKINYDIYFSPQIIDLYRRNE